MKHEPKDCSSYTANLAWLQSSTREPWWLQYFKSVFLEMSIVTIWSVFSNPVTIIKPCSTLFLNCFYNYYYQVDGIGTQRIDKEGIMFCLQCRYVCGLVCVSTPKLLINSGMIWTLLKSSTAFMWQL